MTRALKGYVMPETKFSFPFRMILAGSSGSGKTHFAGKLLKRNDLFEEKITAVYYFYPCYLSDHPVDWHLTLNIPVIYNYGLPTKQELSELPTNSCVVIDDSFDEAVKSSAIDHLFRVISGKRRLAVMIMTQNNFTQGKYGREIRNSCNFSVLFRNCCDTSINENIARRAGLKLAFNSAWNQIKNSEYPCIFIDQSQKGQLTPYRLYTNIFTRYPEVWSVNGMKGYIVGAQDFETIFKVEQNNLKFSAKYGPSSTKIKKKKETIHPSEIEISSWDTNSESDEGSTSGAHQASKICKTTYNRVDSTSESRVSRSSGSKPGTTRSRSGSSDSESGGRSGTSLHKSKKRSKLLRQNSGISSEE